MLVVQYEGGGGGGGGGERERRREGGREGERGLLFNQNSVLFFTFSLLGPPKMIDERSHFHGEETVLMERGRHYHTDLLHRWLFISR